MIIKKNLILSTINKKPIVYDVFYQETKKPKPIVIFCHGYKGFKDWGAWNLVAKKIAEKGFFFLKFNFSHNGGTVDQPIDFPDLEAFANNNFTIELDDLDRILNYLSKNNPFSSEIDFNNISLIGHSRGGGIAIIKAEEHPLVKKVISWAGVSDFKIRFKENTPQFKKWKEKGVFYVENSRTHQKMPHYFRFYEDFIENENRLTIARATKNLSKPQLIVHGTNDTTVNLIEAYNLKKWNTNSILIEIQEANHVFDSKHPWQLTSMSKNLKTVVIKSIEFLKNELIDDLLI